MLWKRETQGGARPGAGRLAANACCALWLQLDSLKNVLNLFFADHGNIFALLGTPAAPP